MNNKKMVQQYLVTALWAESDRNDEPFDRNYSVEDISAKSVARAEKDCAQFYEKAQAALKAEGFDIVELDEELLGHDFWLTRNGHGAGFWDGDYEKRVGEILTKISQEFGEIYAIDDRGQVFIESQQLEAGLSVMVDGKVYGLASRVMAEAKKKSPENQADEPEKKSYEKLTNELISMLESEHIYGCDQHSCDINAAHEHGYGLWAIHLFSGTGASSQEFDDAYDALVRDFGSEFKKDSEAERKHFVENVDHFQCDKCNAVNWDLGSGLYDCDSCGAKKPKKLKLSLEDRADELLAEFSKKISIEETIKDGRKEIEIGDNQFAYGGREVSVWTPDLLLFIWDVNSFGDKHSYMLLDIQDENGETIEESVVQTEIVTESFGRHEEYNYAVNVDGVDSKFYTLPLGRQLDDLKKIQKFTDTAKTTHIGAKGKATLSAVKDWVKDMKPTQYYAKWQEDSSNWKADSVELFYVGARELKPLDEAASGDAPQVYVGTYGKYNSGSIEGKWLNLEDYKSLEEFLEAAKELHKDESDPELMFQDSMNFPEQYYGESYIKPELWDWIALDDREKAIVSAYFEKVGGSKEISEILESCMGQYDNRTDWVFDWIDEGLIQPSESQVYVDDVTARTIGIEDADNYVSDLSESDAVSEAGLEDEYEAAEEKESLQAQLEELESEEEPDQAKIAEIVSQLEKMAAVGKPDEIVAKAREQIATERADSIEEAIKRDAFDYFVNEIGAYTAEDFMKQSFVSVDYQRIARDLELSGITVAEVNGDIYVFND